MERWPYDRRTIVEREIKDPQSARRDGPRDMYPVK